MSRDINVRDPGHRPGSLCAVHLRQRRHRVLLDIRIYRDQRGAAGQSPGRRASGRTDPDVSTEAPRGPAHGRRRTVLSRAQGRRRSRRIAARRRACRSTPLMAISVRETTEITFRALVSASAPSTLGDNRSGAERIHNRTWVSSSTVTTAGSPVRRRTRVRRHRQSTHRSHLAR